MARFNARARQRARRYLVQALYQWQMTGDEPITIEAQYREDFHKEADLAYFTELFPIIVQQASFLDDAYCALLDRPLNDLDPIELAILRLSVYELLHRLDIPYRVVINEGIELAKVFGATESHKFVNGVLDKLAQTVRTVEIQHQSS